MKHYRLNQMKNGWFIGDFEPSVLQTQAFEVGIKTIEQGQVGPLHIHHQSDEVTVVIQGLARMNGRILNPGDICHLVPGQASDFEALETTTLVVVKMPSLPHDKELL